ncbi:MAG: response regulator transcription factor [Verrucomicrobiota bacterium]
MFAAARPSDEAMIDPKVASPLPAPPPAAKANPASPGSDRWTERLLARRYHFPPTGDTDKDLAVRIEHGGTAYWFPLKTSNPRLAERQAKRIHGAVVKQGWETVCRRFSRELIVSFEWCSNPILWTYTTIHTLLTARTGGGSPPVPRPAARCAIVLEKDAGIRRALQWCVRQHPQFDVLPCPSPGRFLQIFASHQPALVLLNRSLAERVGFDLSGGLTALQPGVLALGYSVSVDGDQMFVSTPGGAAGYLLKRVPPSGILEAFQAGPRAANPDRYDLLERAKSSFKDLLRPRAEAGARPLPRLTPRENEVLALLSKGWVDKEIAQALGLSVWTVHGHIKKIFERLRVRTRTEAVVRYLEK